MSTRKLVRPGMGCVMAISLLVVAACGAGTSAGEYVGDQHVASVAAELRADGKTAYYLGPEADGLALTSIDIVKESAPHFEVWAAYGTCRPEPFGEGGCADPLTVGTSVWRSDLVASSCQRLHPQLGVPAGVIQGELTLFTGRLQVRVVDMRDREDGGTGVEHALALLKDLRVVGASQPVDTLPPPRPEVAACGPALWAYPRTDSRAPHGEPARCV